MNNTHIQWCDYSANVIKYRDEDGKSVWACVKVSAGCTNCYAEALAKRYGRGGPFTVGATAKATPYFDEAEAKALLSPKRLPAGSKVFIGDMTDVFGLWVPDELLDRLFAVFALRPDVVFQVLTKRPERMREYIAPPSNDGNNNRLLWLRREAVEKAARTFDLWPDIWEKGSLASGEWPPTNVWLGTSVEDQAAADKRIPELLATPAAVRFISAEPLLGAVDLQRVQPDWLPKEEHPHDPILRLDALQGLITGMDEYVDWDGGGGRRSIDWVIVGGESGQGARACDIGWIRSIVGQCQAAGVAVFVKQLGARPVTLNFGKIEDGSLVPGPFPLKDRKGGDMAEWPKDLRVREFPNA